MRYYNLSLVLLLSLLQCCEAGIFRRRTRSYSTPSYAVRTPHERTTSPDVPPIPASHGPVNEETGTLEEQLVRETNRYRAQHGLRVLVPDARLLNLSRLHGAWMARNRSMTHSRYGVAENIAMGYRTVQDACRGWYNSPGHRANMLNPGHTKIGVSAYTASDGTIFWCQQFSSR